MDMITITIARVPGRRQEIVLNGDRTVETAINAAGEETDASTEIRVNGNVVTGSHRLNNGDMVLLVRRVKGN